MKGTKSSDFLVVVNTGALTEMKPGQYIMPEIFQWQVSSQTWWCTHGSWELIPESIPDHYANGSYEMCVVNTDDDTYDGIKALGLQKLFPNEYKNLLRLEKVPVNMDSTSEAGN